MSDFNDRRGSRPSRYSSRPRRGGGGGRGGRRGRGGPELPTLLGEPSPSLAKINAMNMVKLEAKIAMLTNDRVPLVTKLEKLKAKADPPADPAEIQRTEHLIARLDALKEAAAQRLAGKAERKAAREAGQL